MYNYKSSLQLLSNPFLLVLAVLFAFAACNENPSTSYEGENVDLGANAENSAMVNSNADFPVFHQVFNHNTDPWVGKGVKGAPGWCGSIEHIDRRSNGDINPAVGRGYATVMHGECNDFWDDFFFEVEDIELFEDGSTSAPTTHLSLYSSTFPKSGYVQDLDIYLDPDYGTGNDGKLPTWLDLLGIDDKNVVLSYANAVRVLELVGEDDPEFLYFTILVHKENNHLKIGDIQIDEAGWYTFRHVFGSDYDGSLTVDFELLQNGRLLYTKSFDYSFFGISISSPSSEIETSLKTDNLGSGHIWFPTIADDVELPIDQHRLRPGK